MSRSPKSAIIYCRGRRWPMSATPYLWRVSWSPKSATIYCHGRPYRRPLTYEDCRGLRSRRQNVVAVRHRRPSWTMRNVAVPKAATKYCRGCRCRRPPNYENDRVCRNRWQYIKKFADVAEVGDSSVMTIVSVAEVGNNLLSRSLIAVQIVLVAKHGGTSPVIVRAFSRRQLKLNIISYEEFGDPTNKNQNSKI